MLKTLRESSESSTSAVFVSGIWGFCQFPQNRYLVLEPVVLILEPEVLVLELAVSVQEPALLVLGARPDFGRLLIANMGGVTP